VIPATPSEAFLTGVCVGALAGLYCAEAVGVIELRVAAEQHVVEPSTSLSAGGEGL
jgi:hypothetical protein